MIKAHRASPTDDQAIVAKAPRRKASAAVDAAPKAPRRRSVKTDEPPSVPHSRARPIAADPATNKPARRPRVRAADPTTVSRPAQVVARPLLSHDQPIGMAAQEIARIRAEMRQIRQMIDSQHVIPTDARTLLQRLCQDPTPRGMLAGSTVSVIQLGPHLSRMAERQVDDTPQPARPRRPTPKPRAAIQTATALSLPAAGEALPDAVAEALAPILPATVPAPRSRIARLFSAWGDWLLWRLLPPAIPSSGDKASHAAVASICAASATEMVAPSPGPATGGPDQPSFEDPCPGGQPQIPVAQIVGQMMDDKAIRTHLQEMIREELEGEMGTRFSGNLRAVVRREIALALDDRLTHR